MKRILLIFFLMLLPLSGYCSGDGDRQQKVNIKEILFGHLFDSYEWHFTQIKGKDVCLYLPIIVHSSERGWYSFSSRKLHDAPEYLGFYYAKEGIHEGKVVEKNSNGEEVRPFDISISKNVVGLWFSCFLLTFIVLYTAKWYKQKGVEECAPPKGFRGFMELFIMNIYDTVIKPCVGKDYKKYAPFLLIIFFFIFLSNLLGLIPIFPSGANLTGNIAVTMGLALCTFVTVNVFGNKEYWKDILWPDVPVFLKAPLPIMPIIEIVGIFTKPFALMVRLFANIFAGHSIILVLTSLIFVVAGMGAVIGTSMTAVFVLFSVFMLFLEILVAYIQAYVFTMLSAVFIGLSRQEHLPKKNQQIKTNINQLN